MQQPLIAIVGDVSANRQFDPPLPDPVKAREAAMQLGAELARRNARLLVYGGPFLESDVVSGYVAAKPKTDRCIVMWYSKGETPKDFPEWATHKKLFERRIEDGADWETAFYRSITSADGILLMGGGNATKVTGLIAIGSRMPILALSDFGGGAAKVWSALLAGSDMATRDEISTMAQPWTDVSARNCVAALLSQIERRRTAVSALNPALMAWSGALFVLALASVAFVWGAGAWQVWMLFLAPLLAGGAGSTIRPVADHVRGNTAAAPPILATVVIGLIAGGIAGLLFITAQLTGDPKLAENAGQVAAYATHAIPYAAAVGFVAGLTSDSVFSKLLGMNVVRTAGVGTNAK